MSDNYPPRWLEWAREIQALGQTGLMFSDNDYDIQRYRRLREIAAEIVQSHTGLAKELLIENFSVQPGYATVKTDVRWAMPGGWADVGERPSAMVAREVWEESGFTVTPRKLIGVYDANRQDPMAFYHAYKLVFLCEITGGEARPSAETAAVGFFDFDALPLLSWFRTNNRHLAEVRAHLADADRVAAFD